MVVGESFGQLDIHATESESIVHINCINACSFSDFLGNLVH